MRLNGGKVNLMLEGEDGLVTGNYAFGGINLTDTGLKIRVVLHDLIYPEKMLEKSKPEPVDPDPFSGDNSDYYPDRFYYLIKVNDKGETFLEPTH